MSAESPAQPPAAVLGAGVMGAGIAQVLATGGSRVSLFDPSDAALHAARGRIGAGVEVLGGNSDEVLARIQLAPDLAAAVSHAELVIEAGPEVLAVKQGIFAALDRSARPEAVLASNTSAIPISDIAARVRRRGRVLGTHFWNPPALVPLVEVVQSEATEARHVRWTIELLRRCGLEPVHIVADVPGFVGNRLQHALKREAIALVAAGVCDAGTLDTVVKQGFGSRLGVVGPLEQADLGGLELTLRIHEVVMPALDNTPVPHPLLVEKVARGELGAASGRGFRSWAPGEAQALSERVTTELLERARRRHAADRGPAVVAGDRAEALWGLGGLWIVKLGSAQTGGSFALLEVHMQRGSATPLHRHAADEETFVVLDGALALLVDGRRVDAGAGDVVHLPPGVVHAWRVESQLARFLIVATPQHEAFYRAACRPAPAAVQPPDAGELDLDLVGAAAALHGVELLAPPPDY